MFKNMNENFWRETEFIYSMAKVFWLFALMFLIAASPCLIWKIYNFIKLFNVCKGSCCVPFVGYREPTWQELNNSNRCSLLKGHSGRCLCVSCVDKSPFERWVNSE